MKFEIENAFLPLFKTYLYETKVMSKGLVNIIVRVLHNSRIAQFDWNKICFRIVTDLKLL